MTDKQQPNPEDNKQEKMTALQNDMNRKLTLELTEDDRDLLVNLLIDFRQVGDDGADLTMPTHQRQRLAGVLTRVLADIDYRRAWNHHLLRLYPELPAATPVSDSVMTAVLERGPSALCTEALLRLALSPGQLAEIHQQIVDELPDFWVDAVETAMQQSATQRGVERRATSDFFRRVGDDVQQELREEDVHDQPMVSLDRLDTHAGPSLPVEPLVGSEWRLPGTWIVLQSSGKYDGVKRQCEVEVVIRVGREPDVAHLQLLNLPIAAEVGTWTCNHVEIERAVQSWRLPLPVPDPLVLFLHRQNNDGDQLDAKIEFQSNGESQ